ncbi:RNA polymerase sigma factor SigJ [Pseudonocardia sp. TRM90224]|uniref:RNA polymerase sigma factor SigJ n=1 Tax=Pseudonocardia sp. TRM90224 TaxID=2812678 RepID=UPI001E49357B|nr:RNA polymerase sigma factor SigJ [Pseudonocardia sp. TRM90224]
MTTDDGLDAVMSERRQLIALGYRLLGSLADAEDAVQETYARWYGMSEQQREAVEVPGAWLMKVASRICLDMLGSARARRERYVGEWVPEPLPDDTMAAPADPADRVTLDESISMAFLVVLDAMTPAERVAFVLHDVFRYPFAEVAEIVGRTPAACRQLASSARHRVRDARADAVPTTSHAGIVSDFKHAWAAKDINALIGILDPDVVAVGDGGGIVTAVPYPVHGAQLVARFFADIADRMADMSVEERLVNGQPGLVLHKDGAPVNVMAFDVAAGRITHIWAVLNPEKLRPWAGPPASR